MKKVVFFGSDRYSALVLLELIEAGIVIRSIVTTPPRATRKSSNPEANEVEKTAVKHNLEIAYYPDNKDGLKIFVAKLDAAANKTGVSASFGRIISDEIINSFGKNGIVNIHPSLLPQYRNVAPVPYAIALGDELTGVTIFRINSGIDSGEILGRKTEKIRTTDTSPLLLSRLFVVGAALVIDHLRNVKIPDILIPEEPLIFTRKLTRESGFVEWPVLRKLVQDRPIQLSDTANMLIRLRLTNHPERTDSILPDLTRALDGWEKVWTIADTVKGPLQISLQLNPATRDCYVLIAGKPKPVSWETFASNYLL